MHAFGQMPWRGLVGIVGHTMPELLPDKALIAKKRLVIIGHAIERAAFIIELDVVKSNPVALWVGVCLADRIGLIPGVTETLRHCGQMWLHRTIGLESAIAVLTRCAACHHCAPRRQAHRRFRVTIGEAHAIAAKLVQNRRVHCRMPRCPQQCRGPVVGDNQKNIGLGHWFEGHSELRSRVHSICGMSTTGPGGQPSPRWLFRLRCGAQ